MFSHGCGMVFFTMRSALPFVPLSMNKHLLKLVQGKPDFKQNQNQNNIPFISSVIFIYYPQSTRSCFMLMTVSFCTFPGEVTGCNSLPFNTGFNTFFQSGEGVVFCWSTGRKDKRSVVFQIVLFPHSSSGLWHWESSKWKDPLQGHTNCHSCSNHSVLRLHNRQDPSCELNGGSPSSTQHLFKP